MVDHRDGDDRAGAKAVFQIELAGAAEIELAGAVGIGDVDRFFFDDGADDLGAQIGFAGIVIVNLHGAEGRFFAGGAAEGKFERVGADDDVFKFVAIARKQVEGAAIGAGDFLGGEDDMFEQGVAVALARKRAADMGEALDQRRRLCGGGKCHRGNIARFAGGC